MGGMKRKSVVQLPLSSKRGRPSSGAVARRETSPAAEAAAPRPAAPDAAFSEPREALLSSSSSLFEYLERLPPRTIRSIYALPAPRGPTVAAAVVRSSCLTDVARQCALRLVACGGAFRVAGIVEGWIGRHFRRDALLALRRLEAMGMLEPTLGLARRPGEDGTHEEDEEGVGGEEKRAKLLAKDAVLTLEFKNAMKSYLSTSSSSPWPIITQYELEAFKRAGSDVSKDGVKKKPSRDPPTRQELEVFTQSTWDSVLHFLVGSEDNDSKGADTGMEEFLTRIGLMQEDPDYTGRDRSKAPLVITSRGYEFMLRDINAQVWQFVLHFMNSKAAGADRDVIRAEALSFLICLGSCRVGEGFHSSVLESKNARSVMKYFGKFGLLLVCRVAGKIAFYPTRVAVSLVASNEKGGSGRADLLGQSAAATRSLEDALSAPIPSQSHLAVVVQTNFQVCAYTRSKLHVSTLGLFCDVSSYRRLPNVIFFHLTRDSVRSAFRLGVTADQILRFLHVHAHPMLRSGGGPLVPANVKDQILLWDRERRRVVMNEVWVHQCRDDAEFAAVGQYASDSEAFAWGNAHTKKLYIHFRKSEQVQTYIRKWRTRQLRN